VQLLAIGPAAQGRNRECSATGFLVNEDGYILTNAHVVHDAQRCLAASPKSKILAKVGDGEADAARAVSCDIVGLDEVHDLAILKAERPLATLGDASAGSFALLNAKKVAKGASVLVTGHPVFAWQPETQAGKVIRHTLVGPLAGSASPASGEATQALVINVTLREGHSGSPVYLPNEGGVIGIVIGRQAVEPSHSLAVSAHHIIEFLDDLGVKWHAKR
jgi:S1-C subfamily serine protease